MLIHLYDVHIYLLQCVFYETFITIRDSNCLEPKLLISESKNNQNTFDKAKVITK